MQPMLIFNEGGLDHDPGAQHPERASRLLTLSNFNKRRPDLAERVETLSSQTLGERKALRLVHSLDHLSHLHEIDEQGGGMIDGDTVMSSASYQAALCGVGAGLAGVEAVRHGAPFAFAVIRPPGHHASVNRSMGFCLLNNVAVAAAVLRDQGERVLVLDWDAHHGNGTQDIFYEDSRVFYVSLHEYPAFPGTGALHETGRGEGIGCTMNFPFPSGTGEAVYLEAFDEVLVPVMEQYRPTWILVSAGYDAHYADPLTDLGLRSHTFFLLTARVQELARQHAQGRLVFFLEGGYNLEALAASFETTLEALLVHQGEADRRPPGDGRCREGHEVIERVRSLFLSYWDL